MSIRIKIIKSELLIFLKCLLITFAFWLLLIPYNLYIDFHNQKLENQINSYTTKIEQLEKSFESPISIITRINNQISFFEKWKRNKYLSNYKNHRDLWSKLELDYKRGTIENQFNAKELSAHLNANGIKKLDDYIRLIKINSITNKEYQISNEIYLIEDKLIELSKKQKFKLNNKFEINYNLNGDKPYNKLGITFCVFLIILCICYPFRYLIYFIKSKIA